MAKRRSSRKSSPPKAAAVPMPTRESAGPADRRNMIIVALVALLLRVLFFLMHRHNNPLFDQPIMDGLYHHEWALRIVSGDFWGDGVFFRAPLYPYFLALLYKMSGSSIAFALAVQNLIGTATAVLVYLLAREYLARRVALLAGLIAATYWPFLYFEGDLLIVSLILCLNTAALLLAVRAIRRSDARLAGVAGVLFGLSAIARPSVLIVIPFLPLAMKRPDTTWSYVARRALVLWAGVFVVVSPVLIRNFVVGRDFVPIASQGGVNFYIGNNPESDGRTAIVPGTRWDWWGGYEDAIRLAEESEGRPLKPSEVSNHYLRKGLAFVFGSPGQSMPLLARKLYLFWAGGERSNNKYIYFFWHQSGLGKVPLPGFWLIAPLGLAGAFFLWPRRRELAPLYIFVTAYMAGVVAFFVNARFRLPVVPILIIFGAYAVFYLIGSIRVRHRMMLPAALLVAACFVAVDLDFRTFRENKVHQDALSRYTLGNAFLKQGRPRAAMEEYEEALAIDRRYPTPGFRLVAPGVHYNLGRLYAANDECERAIPLLESFRGDDTQMFSASEILAGCYLAEGRFAEAYALYRKLLGAAPGHHGARNGLVQTAITHSRSLVRDGNPAAAIEVLQRALADLPGEPTLTRELEARSGSRP
jgi:4-amino-4-deoxy-L-arabinose transferase-like glycosyltransferase